MKSLFEARQWWSQLCELGSIEELRSSVRHGNLSACTGLRSACWKIFLLFETTDRTKWQPMLADSRAAYTSLRAHYLEAIEHPDELASTADPLSDNAESPWNALRQDETLREEIFQDVERCMPDNLYFRQPSTQKMLLDILFVFAKLNPDVGYRQGMHELLAPILWVVERDTVDPGSTTNDTTADQQGDILLLETLGPAFVEHDAFTLFALVMRNAKSFYESTEPRSTAGSSTPRSSSVQQKASPMLLRSKRIFERYLMDADPDLAVHLQQIDVAPQIFLMKWLRLLFGREFPFDDMLDMWDLLFAEDPSLSLMDLICVAMLLRIRWQLIEADINTALSLLLRYSQSSPGRGRTFVEDALYLRQNLNPNGGSFIIAKHTDRPPPLPRQIIVRPSTPLNAALRSSERSLSHVGSPSKIFPTQHSIENKLQDAARTLYERGEKWGLGKAVRDAVGEVTRNVQGLQSARGSPRPKSEDVSAQPSNDELLQRITLLEERNKTLAKMLESAVAQLWRCEKDASDVKDRGKSGTSEIGMAIAKVQFVQVFLEDASIQLPTEEEARDVGRPSNEGDSTKSVKDPPEQGDSPTKHVPSIQVEHQASSTGKSSNETHSQSQSGATPSTEAPVQSNSFSFHRSRPSLAQSSFSWMLGEDRRASSFVAAQPFPSEKRRERGTKGFLFGEGDDEGKVGQEPAGKMEREEIGLGTLSK